MPHTKRSGCPINLTLEQLGDRWSLIITRDVMLGNRRSYGELLARSEEGIASNIPPMWEAFMEELRYLHLGAPRPARSVFRELRDAYDEALRAAHG